MEEAKQQQEGLHDSDSALGLVEVEERDRVRLVL